MKKFLRYASFAALPLALLLPLGAQGAAKDQGITRQQADQILNELRQIRQLLERQQAKAPQAQEEQAVRAKVNLEGFAMLGSKEAPLTIVEFTDYQCPFCQRFHTTSLRRAEEELHRHRQGAVLQPGPAARFPPQRHARRRGRPVRQRTGPVLASCAT